MSSHKKSTGKAYKKKSTMKSLFKPTADQERFRAREFPIIECLAFSKWREMDATYVLIARRQDDGRIIIATFMVDLFCLGIKNCFLKANMTQAEYERDAIATIEQKGRLVEISVELAHAIVYGAVDYARSLGFEPHPDYERCRSVLEPQEAFEALPHVEFGKDGKPFYVSGPYDNPDAIMAKLLKNVGEGNFNYLTRM